MSLNFGRRDYCYVHVINYATFPSQIIHLLIKEI